MINTPTPVTTIPEPPAGPIRDFIDDLSALMDRCGMSGYVLYTLTPGGHILSTTSDAAILEAHSLLSVRVHQIKARQSLDTTRPS